MKNTLWSFGHTGTNKNMHNRKPTRSYSEPQSYIRKDYDAVWRSNSSISHKMGKHIVPLRPARSSVGVPKAINGAPSPKTERVVSVVTDQNDQNGKHAQSNTVSTEKNTPQKHKKEAVNGALFTDIAPVKTKTESQHKPKNRTSKSNVLKRDFVEKPHVKRKNAYSPRLPQQPLLVRIKRRLRPTTFAFSMFGAMLVVGASGALIAYGLHVSNSSSVVIDSEIPQVLSQQATGQIRDEQPDPAFLREEKPSPEALANHTSVDGQPKLLSIPSLDVRAKIVPKSVDIGNELLLPENIYDVGWYEASRKPNQPGVVLLHGHVSGPNERGIFYYLRVLEPGDEVRIIDANDKEYTYVVEDKKFVPYDQLRTEDLLVPHDTQKDGLNMVAFDTRFNVISETFQDRLVVYATAK